MKRGRARRRSHYKRTGFIRGRVWLASALAAAAVISGVVVYRTVKGHETGGVRVSMDTSVTGQDSISQEHTGEAGRPASGAQTKKNETSWNIRVVDVKDSVPVEIPAQWQEKPDDSVIEEYFKKKAADLAGQWDREPVDSQMESFDKATGNYRYSEAVSGRRLDQDQLAADLMKAFKDNDRQAAIKAVFQPIPPSRTQAQAKEMYKVIGTFSTTTTNNKNRNQNIRLAVEAIDGMVLKPGDEFSFNMATGNRTSDKGYQPAGAYRNGILIEEPGGGVCQVSTTLYHAIVNSGFKTTERNNHSFAPSYIDKGQDAMVSFDGYAGPDLRFVNTGDASVGLRASFADNKLKLSIVGLPVLEDDKNVSMRSEKVKDLEPPETVYEENPELAYGEEKIVQEAQPGSVWRTYRQLKKNGQVVEETLLNTSTYKAKPAIIQRNSLAVPPESTVAPEGGQAQEGVLTPEGGQAQEGVLTPEGGQTQEGVLTPGSGQAQEGGQTPGSGQAQEGGQTPGGGQSQENILTPEGNGLLLENRAAAPSPGTSGQAAQGAVALEAPGQNTP